MATGNVTITITGTDDPIIDELTTGNESSGGSFGWLMMFIFLVGLRRLSK
jgi:hypothetical protein